MVQRKPFNVKFSDLELERVKAMAERFGESTSSFIRRQVLIVVSEEEDARR